MNNEPLFLLFFTDKTFTQPMYLISYLLYGTLMAVTLQLALDLIITSSRFRYNECQHLKDPE